MLLAGLPEWFLKSIRESLFYRGLFPRVDLLIFLKMTLFPRTKGSFFYIEKWPPVIILRGSLFCFTQAMVTSLYKRNIFEWDVKQSLIINQLISQSIYQSNSHTSPACFSGWARVSGNFRTPGKFPIEFW